MTEIVNAVLTPYASRARLYPAFLALLPMFVLIAVYTSWLEFKASHLIWIIIAGAALFFLADYTRQRGKAVERRLLVKWGGFPSKTLLRHRDQALDPQTKARYHRAAERLIEGLTIPTAVAEAADPSSADQIYESVSRFLLPRTRDKTAFGLLFEENVSYGFCRNLLGLKSIAILILITSTICCSWRAQNIVLAGSFPQQPELTLLVGIVALLVAWVFLVSEKRVRASAEDYAKQLLMALDVL